MILKEIQTELKTADRPVAKAVHKGNGGKAIYIGFKKGMFLKEHKTSVATTLLVLEGKLNYSEGTTEIQLGKFDEHAIPVEILHRVEALEDTLILLIQS